MRLLGRVLLASGFYVLALQQFGCSGSKEGDEPAAEATTEDGAATPPAEDGAATDQAAADQKDKSAATGDQAATPEQPATEAPPETTPPPPPTAAEAATPPPPPVAGDAAGMTPPPPPPPPPTPPSMGMDKPAKGKFVRRYVSSGELRVRAKPSTSSKVLKKLHRGQAVRVTPQGKWGKLEGGGFVSMKYLSASKKGGKSKKKGRKK